jgi:hypothetical protein
MSLETHLSKKLSSVLFIKAEKFMLPDNEAVSNAERKYQNTNISISRA